MLVSGQRGFSAEKFSFMLGPLWSALRNQDQVEVDGGY